MAESICYLNGRLIPLAEATVSVLDRGFIFGDAIYEVIPVFDGVAFRLSEHLMRLGTSLSAVSIEDPLPTHRWKSVIEELIDCNCNGDQSIYVQVTRGVAPRDHVLQNVVEPTIFIMSSPLTVATETKAISAVTVADIRWQRCDIKATSLLANVMSRAHAVGLGSQEAIFIRDGNVTEAAASNIFIAREGIVKTPPLSAQILAGVTRNLLVELFDREIPRVYEESISVFELKTADEVWVTSSSRELIPVVCIDDKSVGTGAVGPVFRRVKSIYQDYKESITSNIC